jgi:hypothetical protein
MNPPCDRLRFYTKMYYVAHVFLVVCGVYLSAEANTTLCIMSRPPETLPHRPSGVSSRACSLYRVS